MNDLPKNAANYESPTPDQFMERAAYNFPTTLYNDYTLQPLHNTLRLSDGGNTLVGLVTGSKVTALELLLGLQSQMARKYQVGQAWLLHNLAAAGRAASAGMRSGAIFRSTFF